MSDSDSDRAGRFRLDLKFLANSSIGAIIRSSDEVFERWSRISMERKEEAGRLMKIYAFWFPILLQPDESNTATSWAIEIGLIDKSGDLSLKHLHKIEILETILRAMDKGSLKKDQAKLAVWIANRFYLRCPEVLEDAVLWVERTEEPEICLRLQELGHINNCYKALHLVFIEFAQYIHKMGTNIEKTINELTSYPPDSFIEKSEEMKKKGNEVFQKKQYEDAVEFYSKAVKYYPDNHIIYGNRALCYIRCEQYLKAVFDGKCATLLKPRWAKGHYRYCEALFCLGEITMALEANSSALSLCKDDRDGLKDLEQQHQKFLTSVTVIKGVGPTGVKNPDCEPCGCPKRSQHKKTDSAKKAEEKKEMQYYTVKPPRSSKFMVGLVRRTPQPTKVSEVKMEKHTQPGKPDQATRTKGSAKDSKTTKSGLPLTNGKAAHSTTPKKQKKETERKRSRQSEDETCVVDSNAALCKQLKSMVEDAYTALDEHRSRNAEQAFSQALELLETSKSKDLDISRVDVLLLLYGQATALTDIGRPEELTEAQRLLEKIKSFDERTFQCLVFFAIGRVYVKENRYTIALEKFSDSLQMVKNQITPGKLTWPLTKKTVKETQPEYLTNILENSIELCRFPPPPDAICRLENCVGSVKAEIFFTDPDFKGFLQIYCSESCVVEYHILCWKNLKTSSFFEKNEKDFLQEACLTPDCIGRICSIKIFGPTGLVKCKFEAAIPKPPTPKKPRVNQKCTSVKKLKSKEDRKLRRKQYKQSFQDNKADGNEILLKTSDSTAQSQQKAWLLYRDRVLLQISQHMHLLREETGLPVAALISSLRPWVELDHSRGNQLAGRMLNWKQEPLETLGQAVEVLLERKNRVWARVLIHLLSSSSDINPKLNSWACHLNNAGLNAAQSFIERYAEHLEQLDLALLLNFGPLQDMVIEKLDTRPEFFSSLGLTVTEYLKQALPHDMRLFIWTLEEHRDNYLSCHSVLDEYFEMMDGHCSVLKKSEENQNSSSVKAKSRGRKKKQKEPKGVIVLSGRRGITPRDEWDHDFVEDDSLSFLLPSDPFSVPSHLREQVTNFEDQYSSSHQNHYKNILDNNPDPTKESLYDYFAQILEEHGPLVAEDPLLVGELENFPAEAQQKIREAGGFEPFLLGSLRFIKMERSIGLAKHAVVLQEADHGPSLDDLDDITDPDKHSQPSFTACLSDYPSVQNGVYPILPNPYIYGFHHPLFLQSLTTANNSKELNGDVNETDCGTLEIEVSSGEITTKETNQNFLRKHAAIQTCQESMRSVAVNTELNELFESCHGDISKKEKSNQELSEQIDMMMNDHVQLYQKRKDDISSLEADMQKTSANIQVTKKELELFQHKLEEEVKKDQKEKKANQEVLKSLKQEIEQLQQEHDSLARRIRGKKTNYDTQLSDFLELSNQSAAEKMSLEDEIKRCKALVSTAVRRSHTAQLSVLESNQDQVLYSLYRELADQRALLSKLDDVAPRHSTQDVEMARKTVRVAVQELEKQISSTETQFQEQKDQVKNGTTVNELHPVSIAEPPEHPFSPPSEGASASLRTPVRIQPTVASAAAEGHKPPIRTWSPHPPLWLTRPLSAFPPFPYLHQVSLLQQRSSHSLLNFSSMCSVLFCNPICNS
uniref:Tetratricopeptide repeat domain 3 n=1 Tax=Sphaeramia orbicularis TaxID=375764 RepID=A0A672Z5B0_9TELE